jgi:hypothetical protein
MSKTIEQAAKDVQSNRKAYTAAKEAAISAEALLETRREEAKVARAAYLASTDALVAAAESDPE